MARHLSYKNDLHPSEVEVIKALDSFAIDFGDGSIMTAKGSEKCGLIECPNGVV